MYAAVPPSSSAVEGVLSRYHWWIMLLKDFYSNKTFTLQQEEELKEKMVKSMRSRRNKRQNRERQRS
jgi:hypothetical protein